MRSRLITVAQEALRPPGTDRLVTGIGRLMTNDPSWGSSFGIIDRAAVAIRKGRVAWVGAEDEIPPQLGDLPRFDCGGRVAVPGFVDAFCQVTGTAGSQVTSEEALVEDVATEWAGRLLAGGGNLFVGVGGNPGEPGRGQGSSRGGKCYKTAASLERWWRTGE